MEFLRRNESGSIITYVVVAFVLATLVVGGVFIVQKTNDNPSKTEVTKTASPTVSTSSPSPTKTPVTNPKESSKPSSAPIKNIPTAGNGSASLPTTGPQDEVIRLLMLAILTSSIVAYVQSYKARIRTYGLANR